MRKLTRILSIATVAVAASMLTACVVPAPYYYGSGGYPYQSAPAPSYPAYQGGYAEPSGYVEHGQVANIEVMQSQTPGYGPSGGGAVAGGLIGGAVGNQIGHGGGRGAATALGLIGGALLGNAIEAQNNAPRVYESYRVSVQTDGGAYRSFDVPSPGDLRIGDRVRIDGNQISRE